VISISSSSFEAASAGGALCRNSIPALKQLGFYNTSSFKIDVAFRAGNRFPQRKNSSNRTHAWALSRWRNGGGNRGQDGSSVTTRHVFWPNQRRRRAWLLPIWLRNSDLFGHGYDRKGERGGGGQRDGSDERAISISSHGILHQMGPCPLWAGSKKSEAQGRATQRHAAAINGFQ
jgi:hypothetical protein